MRNSDTARKKEAHLLCCLNGSIWTSPSLSCCHPSFSPSYNEHKVPGSLFSCGNESEARNHADFLTDKSV